MYKQFDATFYQACDDLSMLRSKLNHVSEGSQMDIYPAFHDLGK